MKKYLLLLPVLLLFLMGCASAQEVDILDPSFPDEEYDPLADFKKEEEEKPLYSGNCLFTYGAMVVGENLAPEDREWEGYHKLGNELGKIPTRMLFSADGNIKMYTKPMENEDWELVKNFNVDRMRVPTNDENVDDIVDFPKAVSYCLMEDTKENADKDFPCITLYPEGLPIQENSPFNVGLCVNGPESMVVNMLKHTFYLHTSY